LICLKWSASISRSAERSAAEASVAAVVCAGQVVGVGAQLGLGARLLELRHALAQPVLEPAPLGDVGDDPADLEGAVGPRAGDRAVMHPAGDAVEADQPVDDLAVLALGQREVELLVGGPVVGVHRVVPVHHLGVGLGPAQEPVAAGPLEELLHGAVLREGDRQVDVRADDVEQAREAVVRLGRAGGRLLARGQVGDDPVDEHAAVALRPRAGAVAQDARDAVEGRDPVGDLGVLAVEQPAVEGLVGGPVVGQDPRLPELAALGARGYLATEQRSDRPLRRVVDVRPGRRDLARVDVLLEEIEDARELGIRASRYGCWAVHGSARVIDARGRGLRRTRRARRREKPGQPCAGKRSCTASRTYRATATGQRVARLPGLELASRS
jgi:hypothetical protein